MTQGLDHNLWSTVKISKYNNNNKISVFLYVLAVGEKRALVFLLSS